MRRDSPKCGSETSVIAGMEELANMREKALVHGLGAYDGIEYSFY